MHELFRALSESGAATSATVLVVVLAAAGILKHLVHAAPAMMRERQIRMLLHQAMTARTKAERDRACDLLRLLVGEPESRLEDPPGG
jgi:hypothetical protein